MSMVFFFVFNTASIWAPNLTAILLFRFFGTLSRIYTMTIGSSSILQPALAAALLWRSVVAPSQICFIRMSELVRWAYTRLARFLVRRTHRLHFPSLSFPS